MGLFAALGATLLLPACGLVGGNSYRFRTIVAVDTPQGVRTGSSIYEVRAQNQWSPLPDVASRTWDVRDEAAAVNLQGGRTLFALLRTARISRT